MKQAVLFDLGNTLVYYFRRSEWPAVLEQAIAGVGELLRAQDWVVDEEEIRRRVEAERGEATSYQVRPLAGRLVRIFGLDEGSLGPDRDLEMRRRFMEPIFARGRRYEDALPALQALREVGVRTAIVSNTPWGSPAVLWREELARHELLGAVDVAVFCGDVGWRKPDRRIFEHTLAKLGAHPEECLFVGDDPRWDLVGPRALGMDAVLIDRHGDWVEEGEPSIRSLLELGVLAGG